MRTPSLFLAASLICTAPVAADDRMPILEVRAGAYITDFDSELRINNSLDIDGSDTDLEDELDMDDGLEDFRVDVKWRINARHAIDFAYYDISRDGRRVIDRQLDIGDETYLIGTDLDSVLDFEVYKLAYAYSFTQSEQSEMSLALGIHAIELGFRTTGTLLNVPVDRHTSSLTVPLPVIGVQYTRSLGGPFSLSFEVDLFALEYDDYKGALWDANLTFDLAFSDNVGVYVGYNFVDLSVESDDEDLLGELDYRYGAVMAGIRLRF